MMDKKGQAALEYLMTYGWALVVIVIVIAALFAFGIFTPTATAPCTGLSKLLYQDHGVSGGNLTLAVANGTGGTITGVTGKWTYGTSTGDCNESGDYTSGGKFSIATADAAVTGSYSVDLNIDYVSAAGIPHTEIATCTGSA